MLLSPDRVSQSLAQSPELIAGGGMAYIAQFLQGTKIRTETS
jgi:hypothetical protein